MQDAHSDWDVLIVGGGIAGLSLGAALAPDRRVAVIDKEPALAAHTTGRSVATFIRSYGNAAIQRLNAASLPFFTSARTVDGRPFARRLPFLYAATAGTEDHLDQIYEAAGRPPGMRFLPGDLAADFCSLLRREWVVRGLTDPSVWDIDVDALVQHHARAVRVGGGSILTSHELSTAAYDGDHWHVTLRRRHVHGVAIGDETQCTAGVIVNAANAWSDVVAARCGAAARHVTPLKRSVFTLELPPVGATAMVNAADEEFYFKPDAGTVLCSPADETPTDPDAHGAEREDELEVARALDALARATVLDTRHVRASWGGLRCFTPDRTPLIEWDPSAPGFFWYTAFGGYGIQTSPAASALGASLLRSGPESDRQPGRHT